MVLMSSQFIIIYHSKFVKIVVKLLDIMSIKFSEQKRFANWVFSYFTSLSERLNFWQQVFIFVLSRMRIKFHLRFTYTSSHRITKFSLKTDHISVGWGLRSPVYAYQYFQLGNGLLIDPGSLPCLWGESIFRQRIDLESHIYTLLSTDSCF